MVLWSKEDDVILRKAVTGAVRAEMRMVGIFRSWEQVAKLVHVVPRLLSVSHHECQKHYQDHVIFTMEDVDLSTFALRYPPWQSIEFETLRGFIHESIPGGRRGDPMLSWMHIAELMNDAHIITHDLLNKSGVNSFGRTYSARDVFLAWKTQIRPKTFGQEWPVVQVDFPEFHGPGDPGSRYEYSQPDQSGKISDAERWRGLIDRDQILRPTEPQFSEYGLHIAESNRWRHQIPWGQQAEDMGPRWPDYEPRGTLDKHPQEISVEHQGTRDETLPLSSAKSQGNQEKRPQHPGVWHLPTRASTANGNGHGTRDEISSDSDVQIQGSRRIDRNHQDDEPIYISSGDEEIHGERQPSMEERENGESRRRHYRPWCHGDEEIYSATDEPKTQARHPQGPSPEVQVNQVNQEKLPQHTASLDPGTQASPPGNSSLRVQEKSPPHTKCPDPESKASPPQDASPGVKKGPKNPPQHTAFSGPEMRQIPPHLDPERLVAQGYRLRARGWSCGLENMFITTYETEIHYPPIPIIRQPGDEEYLDPGEAMICEII